MLMRANIQAVSLKIQTLKSQNAMAQAMKGVTKAMQTMNKQMSPKMIMSTLMTQVTKKISETQLVMCQCIGTMNTTI